MSPAIERSMREWGQANRSDPFAAARARAHFVSGIAVSSNDYETQTLREKRVLHISADQIVEFVVETKVAHRMP